jgi:hypothetical protein
MKIGTIGILNNPSSSINSHSAGWNNIINKQFNSVTLNEDDNWDDYEVLIINHGPNFKPGVFNVIGGISKEVIQRSLKLIHYTGQVYQYDGFQMKDFIAKRSLDLTYDKVIPNLKPTTKDKLIVGDSHSISCWPGSEYSIDRRDGKTLHSFLQNPIKADFYYFGNIDVRFHLGRQVDPIQSTMNLVKNYIELAKQHNAKVSCLLPIESESRKIPGTGLYKGEKFYGSRELRSWLVQLFNAELINSGLEVNIWPQKWYDDIEFYEKEVMEPKQSVHIRPKYYANK